MKNYQCLFFFLFGGLVFRWGIGLLDIFTQKLVEHTPKESIESKNTNTIGFNTEEEEEESEEQYE